MLILAALPFFWVYAGMVRYNVIFIYTQEYDSGGEMFFSLLHAAFIALLLSLLFLEAYLVSIDQHSNGVLGITARIVWHLSIPSLMLLVLSVWHFIHKRHWHVCRALSLQLAKELDRDPRSAARDSLAEGVAYQDPAVSRARIATGDTRPGSEIWRRIMI
eukprot:UN0873